LPEFSAVELDAFLLLNASGLSPKRQFMLLDGLGSAERAVGATDAELGSVDGITTAHICKLREAHRSVDLSEIHRQCEALRITPVPYSSREYPALLKDTHDATPLLFVQGDLQQRDELSVAIVGTRKCSGYGRTVAHRLAEDLARRGFTIVSGLALGIDGEAHEGALDAGGRTVAVMATGPEITYPRQHRELRDRIADGGAVVSEFAFGTPPTRERFPARNRIISGMCLGVIVVEAPVKSGALITARLAGEQGREVFAVPGDVTRPLSRGCHALLKDGAQLVEYAEDVVEGLGILLQAVPERRQLSVEDLPADEQRILENLSFQPRHVDEVVGRADLPASKVTAALMILEMKGLVRRLPGSTFVRL